LSPKAKKEKDVKEVKIKDAFIKLDQALKLSGACDLGSDAKYAIQGGEVSVNGEVEERRGRKLHLGDCFSFDGHDYRIVGA
jgi:S4 domain protein